jgi:hypothetical protein
MKKILVILFLLFLGISVNANATPITFDVDGQPDSYVKITDYSTAFGDTSISALLSDLDAIDNFTLNDNESKVIDFFTLSVEGGGIGTFSLEANLNLDAPVLDASGDGSGGWGTVTLPWWLGGGTYSGGLFWWEEAVQEFTLSDGNVVSISLLDGFALVEGSEVTITATITNHGGGTAPVPEPATMLLLGIGLIGLAVGSRKKLLKK